MNSQKSLTEFLEQCDSDMLKYQTDKEYCFAIYKQIKDIFDACLLHKQYEPLLELILLFNIQKFPKLIHTADTRRIFTIIQASNLELENSSNIFLSSVTTYDEMMTQYVQTIFALRRLELELSESSVQEAKNYLTSIPLSIYFAHFIIERELFENRQYLYQNVFSCFTDIWSDSDKEQWQKYMKESETTHHE